VTSGDRVDHEIVSHEIVSLARRPQSLYHRFPMATAIRHLSLSLASPLPATGSLPLGLLLLRLAR
jgi:hypothetical protein